MTNSEQTSLWPGISAQGDGGRGQEGEGSARPRLRGVDRAQVQMRVVEVERLIGEDHQARAIWEFVGKLDLREDAVIDVENVYRHLRENARRPESDRELPLDLVYEATREVQGSIVYATVIIALVFSPLFFLTGVEGRLLRPLGFAYLVALGASLVITLTVTPALCSMLLPRSKGVLREAVSRGATERLAPILMTALTASLALLPLSLGMGKPGNEIQAPMALVILCGLLSSTFLNMVVLPTVYFRFRRTVPKHLGLG